MAEIAHRAGVKELHIFHHDPDQSDDDIDHKLAEAQDVLTRLGSKTKVLAPAEGQMFQLLHHEVIHPDEVPTIAE